MLLLVGLGNPGREHTNNRHNVGFMAVDEIVRRHGFSPWKKRFHGEIAEGSIDHRKVMVLKPLTFMNNSGVAVGEAARFYKVSPGQTLVAHDELDLAPGKIRIKTGGGHAGHNGLRSIDAHISPDYRRLRIGIGHPGRERVLGFVLQDFSKAERDWLDPLLAAMAEAATFIARGDDPGFMTKVALLTRPPAEKGSDKKESD